MKRLSYIRFASYGVCVAAFFAATPTKRLIPISLWGWKEQAALEDHRSAVSLAAAIPKEKGFQDTRMSGSQVVAAAIAAAKKDGDDMKGYGEPQILLSHEGGRLVWTVSFYQIGGPPGAFFGVSVDDETGATEISPGI